MAWRIIAIENPAQLSTRDNKIVIKQEEEISIPLEDIDSLILDNHAISTSVNLLSELAQNNVATIICDGKHLPASVLLPTSQHSRTAKISRAQITMKEPLRKNIWRQIVIRKIENQAKILERFDFCAESEQLKNLAKMVKTDDSDNRESIAARIYFAKLLDDATRRKPTWYNAALNYGYAIVRSNLAKSLASRGLILAIGVFHHSELNGYNLADDLIEPFRASVDKFILGDLAAQHIGETDANLTREDRARIIDLLNEYVIIGDKKFAIKNATDFVAESFAKTVQSGELTNLILPRIV